MAVFTDADESLFVRIEQEELDRYPESLPSLVHKYDTMWRECEYHRMEHFTRQNLVELQSFFKFGYWSNPWDLEYSESIYVMVDTQLDAIWNYCLLPLIEVESVWMYESDSEDETDEQKGTRKRFFLH